MLAFILLSVHSGKLALGPGGKSENDGQHGAWSFSWHTSFLMLMALLMVHILSHGVHPFL